MGRRSKSPRQAGSPAVPGKKAVRRAARVAAAQARERAARTPRQVHNEMLAGTTELRRPERLDVLDEEIRRVSGPTVPPEMERPLLAPLDYESERRRRGLARVVLLLALAGR